MYRKNRNLYLLVILIVILLFSFLTIYASSSVASTLKVSARAGVLYEPETDSFLFAKNADVRLPMASTTKIMTAVISIENASLAELVEIDEEAVGIEGSSAYLKSGDVLTVEELLYALLLSSANDAAAALAYHISGSIEAFADLMNEKADELGLTNTHFTNPHGLDNEEHYTSAADLARLAGYALKNETLKTISSTYKKSFITEERSRTYVNHNKLLNMYDGVIGMKTGFTKRSGRCLVGAAERDGLTFVTVTLDAPNDWNDHKTMLDYGYATLEKLTLADVGDFSYDIKLLDGTKSSVRVTNTEGCSMILPKGEYDVEEFVKLSRYTVAPISEGDILGKVIFTVNGEVSGEVSLVCSESVGVRTEKGFFRKIYDRIFG